MHHNSLTYKRACWIIVGYLHLFWDSSTAYGSLGIAIGNNPMACWKTRHFLQGFPSWVFCNDYPIIPSLHPQCFLFCW